MVSLCNRNHLKNHKFDDYTEDVMVVDYLIRRIKSNVAYSMSEIMGAKDLGHVV